MLGHLVRKGLLVHDGVGRGTVYFLPWQRQLSRAFFDTTDLSGVDTLSPELNALPPELSALSPELNALPPELEPQEHGRIEPYLEWSALPSTLQIELSELARPVSGHARVAHSLLRATILALCTGRYLGLRVLAHVLQRDSDDLRKRTLKPLITEGILSTAYPSLKDPRQAYIALPEEKTRKP
jgi:hypothetical protein